MVNKRIHNDDNLIKGQIRTIGTRIAFENNWTILREDNVAWPDGLEGQYAYVDRPDFAIIAAIENDTLFMIEQYRYPVGRRLLELPMGTIKNQGDTPLSIVAEAELREETGITAKNIDHIGYIYPLAPLLNQKGAVFVATDLIHGDQNLEPTEQGMDVVAVRTKDIFPMIAKGMILDGVAISVMALLHSKGLL